MSSGPETATNTSANERTEHARRNSRIANEGYDTIAEARQQRSRPSFTTLRKNFQNHNGTIVEEYFSRHVHAGALLVKERDHGLLKRYNYKIHLAYDSSYADPTFNERLRTIRREERQSEILLTGRTRHILVQTAFTLIVYLLNTIDCPSEFRQQKDYKDRCAAAVQSVARDLRQIEQFTRTAAQRSALWYYLWGLPAGAVFGVALVIAVFESDTVYTLANPRLVAAYLASGAVGAIISVMVRVNRGTTLEVDFNRGRAVTILAGGFRPVIGAVFGGVLYVLVVGGILPLQVTQVSNLAVPPDLRAAFFFLGLSFLAGFSERWAQDTIVNSAPKFPSIQRPDPTPDIEGAKTSESASFNSDMRLL